MREFHEFIMEGCPIRESPGQAACAYPKLFVACYALLRLQVPRHPPCALSNLITKFVIILLSNPRAICLLLSKQNRQEYSAKLVFSFSLCSFQGAHSIKVHGHPASSQNDKSQWLIRIATSTCVLIWTHISNFPYSSS